MCIRDRGEGVQAVDEGHHLAVVAGDGKGGGYGGDSPCRRPDRRCPDRRCGGCRRACCGPGRSETAERHEVHPGGGRQPVELALERRLFGGDVGRALHGGDLRGDLLQVGTPAGQLLLLRLQRVHLGLQGGLLGLKLGLLGLEARQLRVLRRDEEGPQQHGHHQASGPDQQGQAVLTDGVHFRLAFLSRLAFGVTEIAKGNEMDPSEFAVVAPWTGLAKYCEPATALIHASEMDRLGPGPVTPSSMVPMAAEVVGLDAPDAPDAPAAGAAALGEAVEPVTTAVAEPWNDCTWAAVGVIAMRLFRARGQSIAESNTLARRARPAVYALLAATTRSYLGTWAFRAAMLEFSESTLFCAL